MARLAAWLGGSVFVASLAACAWWYFVLLAQPARGPRWPALAFDAGLLTLFALHHSLFARDAVKRRLTMVPVHLRRTLYVWIASLLFLAALALWRPIGGELYDVYGVRAAGHAMLQLFGLSLIARAVAGLDPLELAGIREALGLRRPPPALQTGGPYRWVRHPLYLGWVLLFFADAHMTIDRLAFAALTSAYLVAAIPLEERSLVQSFGEDYIRYRRRVQWRMIPFVY